MEVRSANRKEATGCSVYLWGVGGWVGCHLSLIFGPGGIPLGSYGVEGLEEKSALLNTRLVYFLCCSKNDGV